MAAGEEDGWLAHPVTNGDGSEDSHALTSAGASDDSGLAGDEVEGTVENFAADDDDDDTDSSGGGQVPYADVLDRRQLHHTSPHLRAHGRQQDSGGLYR